MIDSAMQLSAVTNSLRKRI